MSGAWAVFWLSPLVILLLGRLIGHETVPAWLWLTTGVASLGAVAIIRPPALPTGFGLFWPIAMALSFSLYVVLTRDLRREALAANLFYTAVGVFIPLSVYVPRIWVTPSLHDAVILFGIGALGFVALLTLDRASDRAPVSTIAAFLSVQVVTVCLINLTRHSTGVTRLMILGVATVVAALGVQWVAAQRSAAVTA
jgi:drug/metabolite transporter (DMT)-like permease